MKRIPLSSLLEPLRDFRRTWPQLLLTDLLGKVLAFVVLTPLVGLLLKLFLLRTETGVLSDDEIASFLLHPIGLLALLTMVGVSLAILFAQSGVLMVIGFGAVEDRRVTYLDALRYVFLRRALGVLEVGGRAALRLLLLSLPFLAGVGAIYLLFLGEHDINFYLAQRPPEFRRAVVLAGILVGALGLLILWQFTVWLLGVPMVLFEGMRGRQALRASAEATRGRRGVLMLWLIGWVLGVFLLSSLLTFVIHLLGELMIPPDVGNILLLVAALGLVLLVSGAANLLVAVVSTALFPLFLVRLYGFLGRPGTLDPQLAARGTLGEKAALAIPGKTLLWGSAAALILVGLVGYAGLQMVSREDDVTIIAHRGASSAAPENTMAAFELAITDGADWIELDVQENADGTVVVEHDSDFMKVAGVGLKVWEATDEELRDIDVGSFFAPEFSDQRVPTLREVLELARGKLGVVIELKYYGHDQALEAKVVEIVEDAQMTSEIVVMSLKYEGIRKIAALRPAWTYGLLTTVSVGDLTRLDLGFLAVNASTASRGLIRRAHKRGMKIYVWTVNDPVQMSVMMSRGADGLITDEPALARQVMEIREDLSPVGRLIVWIAGETGLLRGVAEVSTEADA